MNNKHKKWSLLALALAIGQAAHATAPTPGDFGAYVDFSNITTDVTYVGYLLITLAILFATVKIVKRLVAKA